MKITISVPRQLFAAGEHHAATQGISRSQLYTRALTAYMHAHSEATIVARLNAVHRNSRSQLHPALAAAQHQALADESW
ncbi:MAG: hypothetical protein IPM70_17175 [Proteobacteria bacterium]|jgi:metal-responsive CopG/Arc/MetJ family transcriptional regulator|nr:hypothetical protein [Pseudomonadota bacterium]